MDMFFKSLNIMDYVWCFITAGIICVIAQILIDKTKITPARILVLFVTRGAVLRWSWYISIYYRFCSELVPQFPYLVLVQILQKVQLKEYKKQDYLVHLLAV